MTVPTEPETHDSNAVDASKEEFELRISIDGVCLYLFDTKESQIVAVMPDARISTKSPKITRHGDIPYHPDGFRAVPHAGFLRFDASHLDDQPRAGRFGNTWRPAEYEVVRLIRRELISFKETPANEPPPQNPNVNELGSRIPDFERFAANMEPDPDIMGPAPLSVLTRFVLPQGTLVAQGSVIEWRMEAAATGQEPAEEPNPKYRVQFGRGVFWTRRYTGKSITLQLTEMDGTQQVRSLTLYPTREADGLRAVTIQIANLCEANPLDWADVKEPDAKVAADEDFRWLYQLLRPKAVPSGGPQLPPDRLAVPVPPKEEGGPHGDLQGCGRGGLKVSIAQLTA